MQALSKSLVLNFIEVLQQLRTNESVYDVTLEIEDTEIRGNKLLLSAASSTFREMFESNPCKQHFALKNLDAECVAMLVDCCFKFSYAPLCITEANLARVLHSGIFIGSPGILEECCRYMERNTRNSTCMKYQHILWDILRSTPCLSAADQNIIGVVLKFVTFFIAKNFTSVCCGEDFRQADADQILSLIMLDDLNVPSEDSVLAAIKGWYKADPGNRSSAYPTLLKHVRWPLLSKECLETASGDDDVWACCEVQELIRKSFLYQLRDPNCRGAINFGSPFYLTLRRGMLKNKNIK